LKILNILNKDLWLTSILEKNVYQLNAKAAGSISLLDLPQKSSLVIAKLPVNAYASIHKLQKLNFYLVDTNIQFKKNIVNGQFCSEGIRFANPNDINSIGRIAEQEFIYDRFHSDPTISNDLACKIKSEWAKNYFNNSRGDWMIVAEVRKEVRGFLQLINGKDGSVTIDLIAVDKNIQNHGLASRMIQFAFLNCLPQNGVYRVGTQVSNSPSIALYMKMGFSFVYSQYVFHYHV
jgi:GNAT superfamily N-acetyltransferase